MSYKLLQKDAAEQTLRISTVIAPFCHVGCQSAAGLADVTAPALSPASVSALPSLASSKFIIKLVFQVCYSFIKNF